MEPIIVVGAVLALAIVLTITATATQVYDILRQK
jgi:hypothetical protein